VAIQVHTGRWIASLCEFAMTTAVIPVIASLANSEFCLPDSMTGTPQIIFGELSEVPGD
jgi:hypothetical protein